MALSERLFGRSGGVKLDLAAVQARFAEAVRRGGPPDLALTRARLADRLRDAGREPVLPEEFDAAAVGLDDEGVRRLAVLVTALDLEVVRAALPKITAELAPSATVTAGFVGLAKETPLLTLDVLSQSPLRVEEFTRRFFAVIGVAVAGESVEESKKKLDRLDYGRLLAEAEKAKESAAERAERLRQLQEEAERRRGRRGKW